MRVRNWRFCTILEIESYANVDSKPAAPARMVQKQDCGNASTFNNLNVNEDIKSTHTLAMKSLPAGREPLVRYPAPDVKLM